MKNEIKVSVKDTLKSAILAQWEEQQKLNKELNEKLLNTLTIKDLRKIHKLNEIALQTAKNCNLKEMKEIIKLGLSFMN